MHRLVGFHALAVSMLSLGIAGCQGATGAPSLPGNTSDVVGQNQAVAPNRGGGVGSTQIYVWNGLPGYPKFVNGKAATLLQFGPDAENDSLPLREYALGAPAVFADRDNTFWTAPFNSNSGQPNSSFISHYAATGKLLDKVLPPHLQVFIGSGLDSRQNLYAVQGETYQGLTQGCVSRHTELSVYSASDAWQGPPREVELAGRNAYTACVVPVAADALGNAFVGISQTPKAGSGVILEYGPEAQGRVAPVRTITLPPSGVYVGESQVNIIGGRATDTSGNLYALVNNALSVYAPGSTSGQPLLPGFKIVAFALNAHNHIFAAVQTAASSGSAPATYAIEEFAPGSTAPERTISGSHAHLTAPSAIAVAH